ncbi:hypothetical protein N657DRAFT_217104 [Parathielavia appendiculata]|uniref:Uncharacterized protein n=1 Tax=Parathielavia appendiculata TaxID=2587402 RepID=A0AAN6Z770_9PEZI|nr:hypothetical protein N657DRAFT_217104 [Parathielavia appendiculata]
MRWTLIIRMKAKPCETRLDRLNATVLGLFLACQHRVPLWFGQTCKNSCAIRRPPCFTHAQYHRAQPYRSYTTPRILQQPSLTTEIAAHSHHAKLGQLAILPSPPKMPTTDQPCAAPLHMPPRIPSHVTLPSTSMAALL